MRHIYKTIIFSLALVITCSVQAGTHYTSPQVAYIQEIDLTRDLILLNGELYHMNKHMRVHHSARNLPQKRHLHARQKVKFKTIMNRTTSRVEVREIWVIPQ